MQFSWLLKPALLFKFLNLCSAARTAIYTIHCSRDLSVENVLLAVGIYHLDFDFPNCALQSQLTGYLGQIMRTRAYWTQFAIAVQVSLLFRFLNLCSPARAEYLYHPIQAIPLCRKSLAYNWSRSCSKWLFKHCSSHKERISVAQKKRCYWTQFAIAVKPSLPFTFSSLFSTAHTEYLYHPWQERPVGWKSLAWSWCTSSWNWFFKLYSSGPTDSSIYGKEWERGLTERRWSKLLRKAFLANFPYLFSPARTEYLYLPLQESPLYRKPVCSYRGDFQKWFYKLCTLHTQKVSLTKRGGLTKGSLPYMLGPVFNWPCGPTECLWVFDNWSSPLQSPTCWYLFTNFSSLSSGFTTAMTVHL